MGLSAHLLLKLTRKYEPSAMIRSSFRGKDLAIHTDNEGNPVTLFIGRYDDAGRIRGQRYTRTLKADNSGRIIKDHWDLKGSV
jgi:hypothetical protein